MRCDYDPKPNGHKKTIMICTLLWMKLDIIDNLSS